MFPFSYFVFSLPTESIDNSVWKFQKYFPRVLSFHCPSLTNHFTTNCAHGKIENDDDVIDTVLCIVTVH